jgi:hypothetical protein
MRARLRTVAGPTLGVPRSISKSFGSHAVWWMFLDALHAGFEFPMNIARHDEGLA